MTVPTRFAGRHGVAGDTTAINGIICGAPYDSQQDILEAWFAGVHSDVGGSYPESESQLSKIALQWMVCEAELAGLAVDPQRKADMLGGKPPYVAPDPATNNQHESLHGLWWIAELWPKIVHLETVPGTWKKSIRINLGRRRWISPGSHVHESVERRLNTLRRYRPSNLPQQRDVVADRCMTKGQGRLDLCGD
ncbi:MAG: phospholipase effector Tle1 domain-containing protein [Terriglobales bacterium]